MFIQEFLDLGIEPKGNSEEQKVKCPKCKSLGKENWKDTCLSINTLMGVYNCHKCGYKGTVKKAKEMQQYTKPMKQYTKPSKTNMKRISDR
jgi:twinkle protein